MDPATTLGYLSRTALIALLTLALLAVGFVPAATATAAPQAAPGVSLLPLAKKAFTKTPAPVITGTLKVGKTLTATPGAWKPAGATFKYQWYRNGVKITGGTKATYKLTATDKGKVMKVRVTGSKTGYTSVSKNSKATVKVKAGTFSTKPVPTISGTKQVGKTLTAKTGTWKTKPSSFSYQWYRSGVKITGATKATYKLAKADKGKTITVRVTAKKAGYTSASKTSKATAKIKAAATSKAPASMWNCPASHPIKGNDSSMIYHVPSGSFYSKTKPEQCFSTESAAKAAGYRKSKR